MRKYLLLGMVALLLPVLFAACGGGDTVDNAKDAAGNAAETAQGAANNAGSAVADVAPVRVKLNAQNNSGVSGDAVVTPEGADTARVSFTLSAKDGKQYRVGIWDGKCGSLSGDPKYNLGFAGDGQSTEPVSQSIQDLKDGNSAIALRDGATVVACGEI